MKRIKNKKMITYPVDGLLLVVVVGLGLGLEVEVGVGVVGLGLGLGLEVGVGDVVVCVLVDHRRTHYDKGYIRHNNMHVRPRYGHGNHSSC